MEWFHHLEKGLASLATVGELCLEAIAVLCVLYGMVKTIQLAIQQLSRRRYADVPLTQLRISFGVWLALALEFQLGADILATTIAPSVDALVQLGVIALIRTFLNFFLNKELEKQFELQMHTKANMAEMSNNG